MKTLIYYNVVPFARFIQKPLQVPLQGEINLGYEYDAHSKLSKRSQVNEVEFPIDYEIL